MEKWMCFGAMGVSALMLLLSILDIAIGIPFGGGSTFFLVDLFLLIASLLVGYLGFNASRDLK